jgi:hypothetical protein
VNLPAADVTVLSPGLPDHMVSAGDHVVWVCASALFRQGPDGLTLSSAIPLLGIAHSSTEWAFLFKEDGVLWVEHLVQGRAPTHITLPQGIRSAVLGLSWTVLDHGMERSVVQTETGRAVQIPVGAKDARPQPWLAGPGLTWCDGARIYRLKAGGKVRSAGALDAPPSRWRSGPEGSALFALSDGLVGMSTSSTPVDLPPLDFDTARFSPDGLEVMGLGPLGLIRVDLRTGKPIATLERSGIPVGYSDPPLFLDEETGVLFEWSGRIRAEGFQPCAVTRHEDTLYGPGGTAWNISTGSRRWQDAPLSGAHVTATEHGVAQLDSRVQIFDTEGQLQHDWPLPVNEEVDGEVLDLHWVDGLLTIEVESGWVHLDQTGRRISGVPPELPEELLHSTAPGWAFCEDTGLLTHEEQCWPAAFDGVAFTQDGRALAWSEDGLLLLIAPKKAAALFDRD